TKTPQSPGKGTFGDVFNPGHLDDAGPQQNDKPTPGTSGSSLNPGKGTFGDVFNPGSLETTTGTGNDKQ
ncbi:MAG: hypothetical protein ACR2OM_14955, partial [Aestuariivirgaceae bacterium]